MKLVSLSPSLTDILVGLKAADHLRGVTDRCDLNGRLIERVGSPRAINAVKIQALEPDWILADAQENRPEEIQTLQRRWPVKLFDVRKLSDVTDCIAELGRLTQQGDLGRSLQHSLWSELAENEKTFRDRPRRKTIFLLWNQPLLTVNFDTYASRLIEMSGGENVFRREPVREIPVEIEDLIEKNPELLLLPTEPGPFQKRHISQFRRYRVLSRIPIQLVDGKLLLYYGLKTVEALRELRKIFGSLKQFFAEPAGRHL